MPESLIPSADSPQVAAAEEKWPWSRALSQVTPGRGWQGMCWHSHSQAAWNPQEKLMDYCEHWLPELLHIQCKKEGIKINRVYIPYGVPENLGFYQVQNPASFIIGHLFISYKVEKLITGKTYQCFLFPVTHDYSPKPLGFLRYLQPIIYIPS